MHCSPSPQVKFIRRLPFGRSTALRLWNRAMRLRSRPIVAQTYFGAQMMCEPKDIVQATIAHFGVWEPEISSVMEQVVRPGDVVVDMGANVGYYSLLMSKLVGTSGQVVAIEALARLARQIETHAAMNRANNIRVVNVAAAAERGRIMMFEAPVTNVGASTTCAERGFAPAGEVDALPLTEILSGDEMKRLSLLKCDIEGAEPPIIAQLLDHLDWFGDRLSVQVETNPGKDWPILFDRFKTAGFSAYQFPNDIACHWRDLLAGHEGKGWKQVTSLPGGQTDLLFTRCRLRPFL